MTRSISYGKNERYHYQQKESIFNSLIYRIANFPITASNCKDELQRLGRIAQENGLHSRTINKLLYKHKKKQNEITALENQKENTNNNWISFTYTGNETTKLTNLFK